jgi:hypothetical protein
MILSQDLKTSMFLCNGDDGFLRAVKIYSTPFFGRKVKPSA